MHEKNAAIDLDKTPSDEQPTEKRAHRKTHQELDDERIDRRMEDAMSKKPPASR